MYWASGAQTVNATAKDPQAEVEVEAVYASGGTVDFPEPPPRTYGGGGGEIPTAIRIYVGGFSSQYVIRNTYYD